ncbi:unnamed protein product [Orchesella dallaii]|uniref:C2H2-type domain-containing protein n=1 Tax=Orchesella dallaii TaxID=48710 RepID=A0ABP1RZT5_9HEXA
MSKMELDWGKRSRRTVPQPGTSSVSPLLINLDDDEDFVCGTTSGYIDNQLSEMTRTASESSISTRVSDGLNRVKVEETMGKVPWKTKSQKLLEEAQKHIKKLEDDADKLKKENKLLQRAMRADELEMELATLKEVHEKLRKDFKEVKQQFRLELDLVRIEKETLLADQTNKLKELKEKLQKEAQEEIMKTQKDADKLKIENAMLLQQAEKNAMLEMELDVLKKAHEELKKKLDKTEEQCFAYNVNVTGLKAENREKQTVVLDNEKKLKKPKEELDEKPPQLENATPKIKKEFGSDFYFSKEKKDLELKLEKKEVAMPQQEVLVKNSGLIERVKHLEQGIQGVGASSTLESQYLEQVNESSISIMDTSEEEGSGNGNQAKRVDIVKKKRVRAAIVEADVYDVLSEEMDQEEPMDSSFRDMPSANVDEPNSNSGRKQQEEELAGRKRKMQLPRQPDGLYHCPFCPRKFIHRSARFVHKQLHGPKFICKLCNREYSYAERFRKHLRDNTCENFADELDSSWKKYLKL